MFVSEIYDEAAEILATTDKDKIFRKLTQAVQSLMESGHWYHTNAEVDVCTGWDGQTITLPRGIEVPLAVNIDGSPQYFRGRLFQYHVNGGGMYNPVGWAWDDRGFVATLMDIRQPSQLVAIAESSNDAGKTIRIVGTDSNNRNLRSQLADGTGVDGILLPIHAQSDFPYGMILPDYNTINTREAAVTPINTFLSSVTQLMAGQAMVFSSNQSFPVLVNGTTYYVGNVTTTATGTTIQLFATSLDAMAGNNPISLQSIPSSSATFTLTDQRPCNLLTAVEVPKLGSIQLGLNTPNEVTVVANTNGIPAPLAEGVTYYANQLTPTGTGLYDLQLFNTLLDATNNTNPITLSDYESTSSFYLQVRKAIAPECVFTFTVPHLFNTGDIVQAVTNGGTLPQPLLQNVNYYVHKIDAQTITIHSNYTDAVSGNNPIIATTQGSGVNSFAKLIPATAVIGSSNNIQAPGFNLSSIVANGSGAQVTGYASGGVTNILGSGGNYTVLPSISFSDTGGYGYTTTPTLILSTPIGFSGTAATPTVNMSTDTTTGKKYISSVSVFGSAGSGYSYSNPPTVSFTGGGGYGAIATATVGDVMTSITKVTGGAGYAASAKTFTGVQISDSANPNASGATATVVVNASGSITSITLTASGSGYSTTYSSATGNLTLSGGNDGSGNQIGTPSTAATFTSASSLGAISSITLQPLGSGASATVSFASGSSGSIIASIVNPGSGYIFPPRITLTGGTSTTVAAFYSVITTTSVTQYFIVNPGKGYTIAPAITVTNGGGTGATATSSINTGITALTITNHGAGYGANLNNTGLISATDATGQGFAGTFSTNSSGVITSFVIQNSGYGYTNPTIVFTGASTPSTVAVASPTWGTLISVNPVSLGNNYTSNPTVTVTASTGVYVQFSSTGTLPTPLVSGASYRAEAPDSASSFTVMNTDFSPVNITDEGAGNFYLVISRTFALGFAQAGTINGTPVNATIWSGDFSSFTPNGSTYYTIYFASDYLTPSPMSAGGQYYLYPISSTQAFITDNSYNPITVTELGVGQSYYAVQYTASAVVYNLQFTADNLQYLTSGELVTFTSSGLLPNGMSSATNAYTLSISGNTFTVSPVIGFTDLGSGQLYLNIESTVTVNAATSITAAESVYETGTEVQVRPNTGDTLPSGLSVQTPYFVSRLTNNTFALYNTQQEAQTGGTIGLVTYTNTGNTAESTFLVDAIEPATLVKTVQHVDKPITDGYVSLYAFDNGRSNDMTLIGQYHPSETNPMYRRIRIGKSAAWARILYRVKAPTITSIYDYIPIEQPRAVITAVHAVDLEDKDFMDQAAKYWAMALSYLKNQQNSMDGHAMQPPQINGITYGDRTDPVIDGGYFYF